MQKIMTSGEFSSAAVTRTARFKARLGRASDTIDQLETLLTTYHGLPKDSLITRQNTLLDIIRICDGYVGRHFSGKSRGQKFDTIALLSQQAALRLAQEAQKLTKIGATLDAPGGVNIKGKNRYEKVMAPGARAAGQEAWMTFSGDMEYDLQTASPAEQAYALRRKLKSVGAAGITGAGLRLQHYLTDDEQDMYRIGIDDQGRLVSYGGLLDTRGVNGEPFGQAMYASNNNNTIIVRCYNKESFQQINHSSLLAGANVQCAGTIGAKNGIITDITTASGHYQPDMDDLYNCVYMLLQMGYRQHGAEKVTFFDGRSQYRMPMRTFMRSFGNPRNREDFAGKDYDHDGKYQYNDPDAARRRGCWQ